jgi:hypothetical protein
MRVEKPLRSSSHEKVDATEREGRLDVPPLDNDDNNIDDGG